MMGVNNDQTKEMLKFQANSCAQLMGAPTDAV